MRRSFHVLHIVVDPINRIVHGPVCFQRCGGIKTRFSGFLLQVYLYASASPARFLRREWKCIEGPLC